MPDRATAGAASGVADVHRLLTRGGVFSFPWASVNGAWRAFQANVQTWLHNTAPCVVSPAPASGTAEPGPIRA